MTVRTLSLILVSLALVCLPACAGEDEYQNARKQALAQADTIESRAAESERDAAGLDSRITRIEASIAGLSDSIGAIQDETIRASVQAQVAAKIAELRSQIDATGAQAASLHEDADRARAAADAIRQRVSESDTAVSKAEAAASSAGGMASDLTMLIPGGVGFAGLVGVVVKLLRRGSQFKAEIDKLNGKVGTAKTVVRSIDTVTSVSPELASAWELIKPALFKVQDKAAKDFVNEVQGKTPA